MRNTLIILVLALASIVFQKVVWAQNFTPHYSTYEQYTVVNSTKIHKYVQITGYVELDPFAAQQMSGYYHTAKLTSTDQSLRNGTTYGGVSTGNTVCAACSNYFTYEYDIPVSNGEMFKATVIPDIYCSFLHTWGITRLPPVSKYIEFAYTRVSQPAPQFGTNCANGAGTLTICDFLVGNWCTAYTSPPDMSINKIRYDFAIDGHPWGWEVYGVMYRFGTTGSWQNYGSLGIFAFKDVTAQLLANCTKNP